MINLKKSYIWTMLLLLPVILFWTTEAYPLRLGDPGGEIYGEEKDATEPWPDELIPGTSAYIYNTVGPVDYNYPLIRPPFPSLITGIPTDSEISGYAEPGNHALGAFELGAYARAQTDRTANITSSFSNTFTVGAGTSGLSVGNPVTLSITFSLNGFTEVEGSRYNSNGSNNNYSSWVDVMSRFRIWDPTIEVCGEGCWNPYLIDFDVSLNHQEGANYGYIYNQHSWNWSVDTWNSATNSYDTPFSDSHLDWWELNHNQYGICYDSPESEIGCGERLFDTGMLFLSINTYVGAELYYHGSLNVFSQARGNNTLAIGDFLNTFGGSITADVEGIELSFLIGPSISHEYDTNQDWIIGNFELLDAIDAWAGGGLGNFELLDLIDYWAFGSYCWDTATSSHKAGTPDANGTCQ